MGREARKNKFSKKKFSQLGFTVCINDLDKLNFLAWRFTFKLELIFSYELAIPKSIP